MQAAAASENNRHELLAKARSAYEDFLKLWKEADPNIPLLAQAPRTTACSELRRYWLEDFEVTVYPCQPSFPAQSGFQVAIKVCTRKLVSQCLQRCSRPLAKKLPIDHLIDRQCKHADTVLNDQLTS
jgi:hypothetical protein